MILLPAYESDYPIYVRARTIDRAIQSQNFYCISRRGIENVCNASLSFIASSPFYIRFFFPTNVSFFLEMKLSLTNFRFVHVKLNYFQIFHFLFDVFRRKNLYLLGRRVDEKQLLKFFL